MALKQDYNQFASGLDAELDLRVRLNFLLKMRDLVEAKIPETKLAIKNAPVPKILSELKVYYIVDEVNNKYSVDAAGNLTKI